MQPNSEAASAALELEHYFDSGTYGHAAALAVDPAAPLVEPAQHSNPAEPEDARYFLTGLDQRAPAMQASSDPCPRVGETQRSV